jgi:hypothetical protein
MFNIVNIIIDIIGPLTVAIMFFMSYYLYFNKAFSSKRFYFFMFWHEVIFRYRDYTLEKSKILHSIYYVFWFNFILLIICISIELYNVTMVTPMPVRFIILTTYFLFLLVISFIFYKSSKEKYF